VAKKKLNDWEIAELKRKEYSKTLPKLKFKFEKLVIDPILAIMKKYQEYLTKPENKENYHSMLMISCCG